ncbi:MAG: hypothetical protein HC904_07035 [Blastochloris sp.]|nr:hypothetical protein [Blastochloris sp.]
MIGVKVIYKPLLSLKPTHIAMICVLDKPCQIKELSECLPLPNVILEHAIEELAFWQLVTENENGLELTNNGKVAFAVLQATEKNGFWKCEDDGKWILGEGKFELPETLVDLDSVEWNPETGEILSEATALNAIKESQSALTTSDAYASNGKCVSEFESALKDNGKLDEAVERIMAHTFSVLHLNRVSNELEDFISNLKLPKEDYSGPLKIISTKKKNRMYQIQHLQRDGQRAIWVILAQWLRQRSGVLGELIIQHPSAFRCISTIGIPLWEEEGKAETPAFSQLDREQTDVADSGDVFYIGLRNNSSVLRM